jgi:hypothetical protein
MRIGDDNSDGTAAPLVNCAINGINVIVFFVLQGMGANDKVHVLHFVCSARDRDWQGCCH